MYYLFREKGWAPTKFYNLSYGEKEIVRAFTRKEIREQNESQEKIDKMLKG